jgi:hypothetical protein
MLPTNLVYAASLFVKMAYIFLNGVIAWLVLKGISVGLNMIVETNLNYRERKMEESHE